jgi:asparagine synthetase B (glutamine-hydrolysing)
VLNCNTPRYKSSIEECDVNDQNALSHEKRYPYLDRDLLAFLYAIPWEQLVRPGERRSLLRRALAGIVPVEVLNRRRKAYVSRTPLTAIGKAWECFAPLGTNMVAALLGIVNANLFAEVLERARQGREVPIVGLKRTLELEIWLRARERWASPKHPSANETVHAARIKEPDGRWVNEVHRSLG